MQTFILAVQILIWLLIVPLVIGTRLAMLSAHEKSFGENYAYGMFFSWAVFELLAVPMIAWNLSLRKLIVAWVLVMVAMCVYSAASILKKKGAKALLADGKAGVCAIWKRPVMQKIFLVAILLIVFMQIIVYVFYGRRDDDDARYIASALSACERGTMLRTNPFTGEELAAPVGELCKDMVAPWVMYIAALSKIMRVHPAIMAHTILPVFLLCLGYIAYGVIAKRIFESEDKRVLFLLLISVCLMFTAVTTQTSASFFFRRLWQGKAVVAGVMIPFLYGFLPVILEKPEEKKNFLLLLIINSATCLLSGIGIVSALMMSGLALLSYAIQKKKLSILILGGLACLPNLIAGILYARV